jgi:hypothetical protein
MVDEVGELMLASFPFYNFSQSVIEEEWWLGEKYDGVRCCWNAIHNKAYL